VLAATALLAASAWAQRPPAAGQWQIEAAALIEDEADVGGGGEVSANRAFVELGRNWRLDEQTGLGVSIGYGVHRYDFNGTGFASPEPWGHIRELELGARVTRRFDDRWTGYAIPSARLAAERGADLGDGATFGLLAGATYRISDGLSLGPGIGVFSELEDDASVIPILLIDWKITDRLALQTGGGFAASRGPGLRLRWRHDDHWDLSVGARYEKRRFRLDDSGPAAGGVGEETSVPLTAIASYSPDPSLRLSMIAGARAGADLALLDGAGRELASADPDTQYFAGLAVRWTP
jgi:hypothetical protein